MNDIVEDPLYLIEFIQSLWDHVVQKVKEEIKLNKKKDLISFDPPAEKKEKEKKK